MGFMDNVKGFAAKVGSAVENAMCITNVLELVGSPAVLYSVG